MDIPVTIRERQFFQAKSHVQGTHRSIAPVETLRLIRPLFPAAGITRLANVTHLDRIGIPVVLSIRPDGLFLGADAGKGYDLDAAKTSAAMEAIERWRAETGDFVDLTCTFDELVERYPQIHGQEPVRAPDGGFSRHWKYRWTIGWDLLNAHDAAVPTLAVEMPSRGKIIGDLGLVMWDSSGLSSGNNLLEAIHSALLELVERDAVTCVKWAMLRRNHSPPLLDLRRVADAVAVGMIERLESNGIEVTVADCTIDTCIATYWAAIRDRSQPGVGVFGGYGAHTDPGIAVGRAIAEAVQSRLVFISGSRDDIFKRDLHAVRRGDRAGRPYAIELGARTASPDDAPNLSSTSFHEDIHAILKRLRAAGIERAVVCDLSHPSMPISVVRIVVPGLEGYLSGAYSPGKRASTFAGVAA